MNVRSIALTIMSVLAVILVLQYAAVSPDSHRPGRADQLCARAARRHPGPPRAVAMDWRGAGDRAVVRHPGLQHLQAGAAIHRDRGRGAQCDPAAGGTHQGRAALRGRECDREDAARGQRNRQGRRRSVRPGADAARCHESAGGRARLPRDRIPVGRWQERPGVPRAVRDGPLPGLLSPRHRRPVQAQAGEDRRTDADQEEDHRPDHGRHQQADQRLPARPGLDQRTGRRAHRPGAVVLRRAAVRRLGTVRRDLQFDPLPRSVDRHRRPRRRRRSCSSTTC